MGGFANKGIFTYIVPFEKRDWKRFVIVMIPWYVWYETPLTLTVLREEDVTLDKFTSEAVI